MGKWTGRLIPPLIVIAVVLGIGVYLGLIEVSTGGVRIMHESDLSTGQLIARGDLYLRMLKYEDAIRCYCQALFKQRPGRKKIGEDYRPEDGDVDLSNIPDYPLPNLPQTEVTLYNIAVCHTNLGQVWEAQQVYAAFKQLYPNSRLISSVERNLEAIRQNKL
jgi:tetratricopeptide (TPR) repeat protein